MTPIPTGLSSQAIHGWGDHHPWDPADLLRCVRYCDGYLTTAELRARMSGRSVQWDRLLSEWDNLVALLRSEMDNRTDGMAPRTYAAMKRVLANGVACAACDGTGYSDPCLKCKGTGRRAGGRCRAEDCYRGLHHCRACTGHGYTTTKDAA